MPAPAKNFGSWGPRRELAQCSDLPCGGPKWLLCGRHLEALLGCLRCLVCGCKLWGNEGQGQPARQPWGSGFSVSHLEV